MATSSGYTVPSASYTVSEENGEKSGRWIATVAYRIKDGRSWTELATVRLREHARGTIELDVGGRRGAQRARTGTHDRQEAINQAVKQVGMMAKEAVRDRELTRTIRGGEGGITMMGGFKIWLDTKMEARRRNPKKGVTGHTINCMRQACEIAVNMKGRDFRLAELVGQMEDFTTDFLAYRMAGFTFNEELVTKLNLKSTGTRRGVVYNTAQKDIVRICGVLNLVAKAVDPENPDRKLLRVNPVKTNGFEVPEEDNSRQGKSPISWATQALLLSPMKRGDKIEPAPVDQVDNDGSTRLAVAMMGHHGMRRETPLTRQRKHFAVTPEEVRAMRAEHGRYLREEDLEHYVDRIWILHDDTKMEHRDPTHFIRPVPCNRILEAEVRRYFDRHDLWDSDPDTYVLSPDAPDQPGSNYTLYAPNRYEVVRGADGEKVRGRDGRHIPVIGDDGLPIIRRNGGQLQRAFNILRKHLQEQGVDWTKHIPAKIGEAAHGFRVNLEESVVTRLWVQIADVKGLGDELKKQDLTRYADYLLNRKMYSSVRNERYAMLEPLLLLAVVDHENGLEAAVRNAKLRIEEDRDPMDAMARAAGL